MHIRTFRNGDEAALHAIFHSSVYALACKDYTTEQLDAWAPRQYDAAQWGEWVRGSQRLPRPRAKAGERESARHVAAVRSEPCLAASRT